LQLFCKAVLFNIKAMKNIIFKLLTISFIILQSCNSDKAENTSEAIQDILLKKVIFSYGSNLDIEYQGNKLKRFTSSDGTYSEFCIQEIK